VRRLALLLVVAAVMTAMLALSASPALAFIHTQIPAGFCPQPVAHDAADNETAENALTSRGAVFQKVQTIPLGNVTKAPQRCPATS
jgi:hypothetical protein